MRTHDRAHDAGLAHSNDQTQGIHAPIGRCVVVTAAQAGRGTTGSSTDAVPVDLVFVVAFALLVDALTIASIGWAPVRFVLGAIFLFVLPGYAVLAALYPGRPERTADDAGVVPQLAEPHEGLVFTERLAMAFGTSVALIPVTAVVLGLLGVALTPTTILGTLTVVVIGFAAIGSIRRARLAPDRRYAPFGHRATRSDGGRTRGEYRGSTVLAAGLVLAVALAGGAFVYGIAAEPPGTEYTSASLLTSDTGGEFTASGYPTNATVGEPTEITLRVENHRQQPVNVTAVGYLEGAGTPDDGAVERDRVVTLEQRIPANGRWNGTHEVTPTFAGEDLRLGYYLYHGEEPGVVDAETADRELYLRIDVDEE